MRRAYSSRHSRRQTVSRSGNRDHRRLHTFKGHALHPADVAVRSSATAEDLPDASFAGPQETYLNVCGHLAVLDCCKCSFASLFTDRAIFYRTDKNFDHFKVALSIGVQLMVRSDLAVRHRAITRTSPSSSSSKGSTASRSIPTPSSRPGCSWQTKRPAKRSETRLLQIAESRERCRIAASDAARSLSSKGLTVMPAIVREARQRTLTL